MANISPLFDFLEYLDIFNRKPILSDKHIYHLVIDLKKPIEHKFNRFLLCMNIW